MDTFLVVRILFGPGRAYEKCFWNFARSGMGVFALRSEAEPLSVVLHHCAVQRNGDDKCPNGP